MAKKMMDLLWSVILAFTGIAIAEMILWDSGIMGKAIVAVTAIVAIWFVAKMAMKVYREYKKAINSLFGREERDS